MAILGIHMKMEIGSQVPAPVPLRLKEALQSVQVTTSDSERSGFELKFQIGRGVLERMDYPLVKSPLLKPFNRVLLRIYFNVTPHALMDGIITDQQLVPGDDPGSSTLTITGKDVSLLLDLEVKVQPHPGEPDNAIVTKRIASYNLKPLVSPLPAQDPPLPTQIVPSQHSTDMAYIEALAQRHGYTFYIIPGLKTALTQAYWGPPRREGKPQKALAVNMGPHTNVSSINFHYQGMQANKVMYMDGEERRTIQSATRIPLVRDPAPLERLVFLSNTGQLSGQRLQDYAQAQVDNSLDQVVTASGELDTLRYGRLLQPRQTVDLRGAGESYDGTYYVKSVTHNINVRQGSYTQGFTLAREGLGVRLPVVSVE